MEKALAEIAREAWWGGTGADWQSVADAVIAAHEARRWKAWPPHSGTREALAYRKDAGVFPVESVDYGADGADWFTAGGRWHLTGDELPTLWTPIPAPPKEAE